MLKKTNLIDTNFQIKSQDHHKSETDNHIQELTKRPLVYILVGKLSIHVKTSRKRT